MNEPYKVVIVDDEMISRGYMGLFIKPSNRYEIVSTLTYAQEAITWCKEHPLPDLIIMDVMMAEGIDGLTAAGELKQLYPQIRIVVATSMADTDWLEKARQLGIESFWFKTYSEVSLLEVMDRTMAGESVYPQKTPELMFGNLPASELTKQQRNLLRLLTEGLTNKEIAEKMGLSPNTVKDYLDDIMELTGIHSRTALVAKVSRLGIVVSEADRLSLKDDNNEPTYQ